MAATKGDGNFKVIATNRRARQNFSIVDTVEAGIVLQGSEVKAIRAGRIELKDAYAHIDRGEVLLLGVHIAPYDFARDGGHEPERARKLLLHRREIDRLAGQIAEKGLTLVPLRVYLKEGRAKVELGLAKGKTSYDKRETLKERDAEREVQRAMRRR